MINDYESNVNPEKGTYKDITPFKMFIKGYFPFIEDTMEAVDNYGLLCKVVEYLNEVIYNENTTISNINSLYNAFRSLKLEIENYINTDVVPILNEKIEYIDNYFNNLDVQEEINNKIDSLVEDGTFGAIVDSYLEPYKQEINAEIADIYSLVGKAVNSNPIPVSSTSEMTNTAKIYVNVSDGYWYYYNGTNWIQGGVYQSTVDLEKVRKNSENNVIIANKLNGFFPNIFHNTWADSQTSQGVTYTKTSDRRIKAEGTATYRSYIQKIITLPAGKYTISGCTGGSSSTYMILYQASGDSVHYVYNGKNTLTLDEEKSVTIQLVVLQGVTVDTTFSLMIQPDTNPIILDDYVEYGILYIKENIIDLINNITGYKKPNLYQVTESTINRTYNGIQFTLNSDKTITLNGTTNSSFSYAIGGVYLEAGTYILSLDNEPKNGFSFRKHISSSNYTDSYYKPIKFTLEERTFVNLYLVFSSSNIVFDNYKLYPMIREASVYNDKYVQKGEYQIYKPIQELINYTKFNWSGKKLNGLGDSILQGSYGNFIDVIGGILNLSTVRNYGISGSLIASSSVDSQLPPACTRYTEMDNDADIILVHAGTNDYSAQIPLGENNSTDITTFNGALNVLMNGLKEKYPEKLIIFDSILHRYNDNTLTIPCSVYRECIENRALANHVIFYDCYKYGGFDMVAEYYSHNLSPDGLHLNQTGADILGRKLSGFINWQ